MYLMSLIQTVEDLWTRHSADTNVHGFDVGLLPFRSPLIGESLLFSFPPRTKMLQSRGLSNPNHTRQACC